MTWLCRVAFAAYLLAVLLITWLPSEEAGKVTGIVDAIAGMLVPLGIPFDIGYSTLEFLANIALFLPLGALHVLAWHRLPWWTAALGGFALSAVIELVQIVLPTRYSTVSDVIANSMGALVGALLVVAVRRIRRAARTVET